MEHKNKALIRETWDFKARLADLAGNRGILFCCVSVERPRASAYIAGIDATPIPTLCSIDTLAILV
jgi:hypothetical protein